MAKRFSTRTILIVLLILLIVVAAIVVITNLPPQVKYLSPEEVWGNRSQYSNQSITVKGYYDTVPDPVIASTASTTADRSTIKIDYSHVENATDHLIKGHQYLFTGTLIVDETNPISPVVILVLSKQPTEF